MMSCLHFTDERGNPVRLMLGGPTYFLPLGGTIRDQGGES